MSYRRRNENVLLSSLLGLGTGVALVGGLVLLLALPADSQTANPAGSMSGDFERPWGFGYGQESQPFEASSRDASGNRTIIDGLLEGGTGLSTYANASANAYASASSQASGAGYSQGSAIGNQINVITQGNYNTVVVNATQTNNGNQNTVLNGSLNLDD
jgi:holdfast attachment protein HfaA